MGQCSNCGQPYTPGDLTYSFAGGLKEVVTAIEALRHDILFAESDDFDIIKTVKVFPVAEQHMLLAVALLEQAQRHAKLAVLYVDGC